MADKGNVLIYFESAKESFMRKDYIHAAIYFQLCYLAYKSGELFVSNSAVQCRGADALKMYDKIMRDYLSSEERKRFQNEDDIFERMDDSLK